MCYWVMTLTKILVLLLDDGGENISDTGLDQYLILVWISIWYIKKGHLVHKYIFWILNQPPFSFLRLIPRTTCWRGSKMSRWAVCLVNWTDNSSSSKSVRTATSTCLTTQQLSPSMTVSTAAFFSDLSRAACFSETVKTSSVWWPVSSFAHETVKRWRCSWAVPLSPSSSHLRGWSSAAFSTTTPSWPSTSRTPGSAYSTTTGATSMTSRQCLERTTGACCLRLQRFQILYQTQTQSLNSSRFESPPTQHAALCLWQREGDVRTVKSPASLFSLLENTPLQTPAN